jgi:chromosome segregation ATPase
MISREELQILQEKLTQLSKRKSDLEASIRTKSEFKKNLPELRQKIEVLSRENEAEEERQMDELAEAQAERKKLRSIDSVTPKLAEAEETLSGLQEKHDRVSVSLEELTATDTSNQAQITPLSTQLRKTKAFFARIEKVGGKLPPLSPMILRLEDLEDTKAQLTALLERSLVEIPRLAAKIEGKTGKIQMRKLELHRRDSEVDSWHHSIDQAKLQVASIFGQLEKLSIQRQTDNARLKMETDQALAEREAMDRKSAEWKAESAKLEGRLAAEKAGLDSVPDQIQAAYDDGETLLHKKKSMLEQLEKKLDEVRQNLLRRQAEDPTVQKLTAHLESEWVEHHRLFETAERRERKLQNTQDDLKRVSIAIQEAQRLWPADGKVKRKKGVPELEAIYEEALTDNRNLGMEVAFLDDEVSVLEDIHRTLELEVAPADK